MTTLLGAGIGSFLGMAAYRLPRGVSFVQPSRSFCPGCNVIVPWYRNLPVFSWLWQRGRCFCPKRQALSARYLVLEFSCAVLFATNFFLTQNGWPQLVFLSLFCAYALLTGAIDLEHRIIPTSLSVQMAIVGAVYSASGWNPAMAGEGISRRLAVSVSGAIAGAAVVAGLMLLGKTLCRPKPHRFEPPVEIEVVGTKVRSRQGDEPWDESSVTDFLVLPWERLEFRSAGRVETVTLRTATPTYRYHDLQVQEIVAPQDAIGWGDLKWLAALGAWVGPLGALETMGLSSILACFGIVFVWVKNRQKPSGMSFGPWLSVAAYLLMVAGKNV